MVLLYVSVQNLARPTRLESNRTISTLNSVVKLPVGVKLHKLHSVMQFINSLKCVESHYCKGKSNRKYLPSELSIKGLWKMYSEIEGNVPVKESYFRMTFNTNYNLGFGSPRSDVFSLCL